MIRNLVQINLSCSMFASVAQWKPIDRSGPPDVGTRPSAPLQVKTLEGSRSIPQSISARLPKARQLIGRLRRSWRLGRREEWGQKLRLTVRVDDGSDIKWRISRGRQKSSETTHDFLLVCLSPSIEMREIVHLQAGQCGNQIGSKVSESGNPWVEYFQIF